MRNTGITQTREPLPKPKTRIQSKPISLPVGWWWRSVVDDVIILDMSPDDDVMMFERWWEEDPPPDNTPFSMSMLYWLFWFFTFLKEVKCGQ